MEGISKSWINILNESEVKSILSKIYEITPKNKLAPPEGKIFEFARLTNLDNVKVIILGQDPYINGEAHGLAFSSKAITPSLKNIFKCLKNDKMINDIPSHGNLTKWAKQGVLLLNAALTTELGTSNLHRKEWAAYTKKLIKNISDYGIKNNKRFIFVLWGTFAKKFVKIINANHIILESMHPSPLSHTRTKDKFESCQHFKKINDILTQMDMPPIDWDISDNELTDTDNTTNTGDDEASKISMPQLVINKIPGKKYRSDTSVWFSDGSCTSNGKANAEGGYAAICVLGEWEDTSILGKLDNRTVRASNIRAEGMAILSILEYLSKEMHKPWKTCIIITDSMFWKDMVYKYMPKWNDYQFKTKANSDMTKKIWTLWNNIMGNEKDLEIVHTYGHNKSGNAMSKNLYDKFCFDNNDAVDKLANYARTLDVYHMIYKKEVK